MRVKLRTLACALAGALAVYPQAYAANKAEVLETGTVDVVSTTPLPGIGTPRDEVPANVQTTGVKEVEQQHTLEMADLINSTLGSVSINEGQSNPFMADVFFRGFTASPLAGAPQGLSVFQDGVRVNEPFGDTVNWGLIPESAISSINLIPGSNPVFGLNTLGGALAVHTKSGAQYPGFAAQVSGGSWGRKAGEFEFGGSKGNVDYFLTANMFSEDGWRDHSPSQVNQMFGKLGWQDETSDLDLSLTLARNNLEGIQALPNSWMNKPELAYTWPDIVENRLFFTNLKGSHFFGENHLVAANVYFRRSRINNFASNTNDCFGAAGAAILPGGACDQTVPEPVDIAAQGFNEQSSTDQFGYGLAAQYSYLGDAFGHKNQLTAGVSMDFGRSGYKASEQTTDFSADRGAVATSGFGLETDVKTRNSYYGLFATDTFSVNDKLHLTLSGRYNYIRVSLKDNMEADANTGKFVTGDTPSISHTFNRFNPAVGLNYNPSKSLGFYGSYNEGMRAPTPIELSCADPLTPCRLPTDFLADPTLKPVVSKTWEGGVRGKLGSDWGWNATLFRSTLHDDLQFISSGNSFNLGYFENVGKTRRQGLELGLNGKLEKLHLGASYQLLDATFQSPMTFHNESNSSADANGDIQVRPGDKIPNIARHALKLRAAYDFLPEMTVGMTMIANSSVYARGDENNQDENGKVPGYAVFNLDANWRIHSNWNLFAKVNNVFDRDYATMGVLGTNAFTGAGKTFDTVPGNWADEQFRSPGSPRAAWVGVRYEFGAPAKSAGGGAGFDND
jgi:outer membrane receptor protein involved in Fe transport